MTTLRTWFVLAAALAGSLAAPVQAQLNLACNQNSFPSFMTLGTTYDLACEATGGTSPYSFSFSSGAIHSGMSTFVAGAEFFVEGTVNALGAYSFTVTAKDNAGVSSSLSF